jgi:hypothetical protein
MRVLLRGLVSFAVALCWSEAARAGSIALDHPPPYPLAPADPNAPVPGFRKDTRTRLLQCMGFADQEFFIAEAKLHGESSDQLKARWSKVPNFETTAKLIDATYRNEVKDAWGYSTDFFDECASSAAHLLPEAVPFASYCWQNTLIASTAWQYRDAGKPVGDVYRYLAPFGRGAHEVVDKVYAESKDRGDVILGAWDDCMAHFPTPQ